MEFTLESAFSAKGLLGHSAYLLLVASMLMTRILWLRLLVILSALVGIAYAGLILHDPVGVFWETMLVSANVGQIGYGWWQDRKCRFTEEERYLTAVLLPGLPPSRQRRFLDRGQWINAPAGLVMTREGKPAPALFWIARGRARVLLGGTEFATAGMGEVVGEFSSLSGDGASATVVLSEKSRLWFIDAPQLRETVAASHDLGNALQHSLSRDVRQKLLRASRRVAELSGKNEPGRPALSLAQAG